MCGQWQRRPLLLSTTVVVAVAMLAIVHHTHCGVAAALPPARPSGADGTKPPSGWARPPLLRIVPDVTYGTPVRRLSTPGWPSSFTSILRAGLQVEHAGGYVLLYQGRHDKSRHSRNMSVYERQSGRPWTRPAVTAGGMPHWRPGEGAPEVAYFRGSGSSRISLELLTVDVSSGTVLNLARPAAIAPVGGSMEGAGAVQVALAAVYPAAYRAHWEVAYPSRDGRRYVWWADRGVDSSARGVLALDLSSAPPAVLGLLTSWPPARGRVLAARITPSGRAVLVHFELAGVYVYDTGLSSGGRRVMATRLLTDDAADVMVASGSGHDTIVGINDEEDSEDGGWVVAVDLVTLDRAPLFPVPRDEGPGGVRPRVAVSGQAYDRPGWVVLSADACAAAAGDWLCDKVVAMEVATRRVVPLGTAFACRDLEYRRRQELPAAAATPNRDLSRVYFTRASGQGRCTGAVELYELSTAGRLGGLPARDAEGGLAPRRPAATPQPARGGGGGSTSSPPAAAGVPTTKLNVGIAI